MKGLVGAGPGHPAEDANRRRMRAALRRVIDRVEVTPADQPGQVNVRLVGRLDELVRLIAGNAEGTNALVTVVAGTRNLGQLTLRAVKV